MARAPFLFIETVEALGRKGARTLTADGRFRTSNAGL